MTTRARADVAQQRWLRPADVSRQLRKRWDRGEFLSGLARHQEWTPLPVGLRSPTSTELAGQFGAVQDWLEAWRRAVAAGLRLEWERVGGRLVGANEVPARIWIDDREALWRLLGVRADVAAFTGLADETQRERPDLAGWVADHPMKALAHAGVWARLLAVVDWIEANAAPEVYLRQIDVPGVDTKFVEKHQAILAELLDHALPPERIDAGQPRSKFLDRYRLARKPSYVRLRRLDGGPLLGGPLLGGSLENAVGNAGGPAEIGLRVADLARSPIDARVVFVVENDVTYLALPPVPDAVAVLGEGYAVSRLSSIGWLAQRDVVYWGDLDTHGFVMLDRLRSAFPSARSMLMDRHTFLDHEAHWGSEDVPANVVLDRLDPDEAALYQDLVEGRYGERLRLEQERIRFSAVRTAMALAARQS